MAGITSKLTEAWIAQDYFVFLNNCEIREVDVLDLEIMYGGCSVNGLLTIQDTQGHMDGSVDGAPSLQQGGFCRVTWTAAGGCGGEYDETFSIEQVKSSTNESNKRILTITLVDTDTRNEKGAFKSVNYNKKKPSEIVKEHIKTNITSGIKPQREMKITPHKKESKTTLTVPSNMDAFSFLNTWLPQQGYARIKDKFTDYLVSKQTTEHDKMASSKEEFDVDPNSAFSFWRVLQYNLNGFDVNALMDSIPTVLSNTSGSLNHDGDDKELFDKKSYETSHVKTAQKGTQKKGIAGKGTKTGVKNNSNLQQYFNTLSNAQTCSIWVPGLNKNRIGFKSRVNFPRPSYLASDSYDLTFSGEWEVTAVRDKIIKQYFIQELFLRRLS